MSEILFLVIAAWTAQNVTYLRNILRCPSWRARRGSGPQDVNWLSWKSHQWTLEISNVHVDTSNRREYSKVNRIAKKLNGWSINYFCLSEDTRRQNSLITLKLTQWKRHSLYALKRRGNAGVFSYYNAVTLSSYPIPSDRSIKPVMMRWKDKFVSSSRKTLGPQISITLKLPGVYENDLRNLWNLLLLSIFLGIFAKWLLWIPNPSLR